MNINIIPFWAKALILIAILGGIFGSGYYVGSYVCDNDHTKEQLASLNAAVEREHALEEDLRGVSARLQAALRDVQTLSASRSPVIMREVERPVYRSCSVPQSGVEVLNDNSSQYNNLRRKP